MPPPDPQPESPRAHRRQALALLRRLLRRLGWTYRIYLPLYLLLSAVYLLPPQLLKFFTREIHLLAETSSSLLLSRVVLFGALIATCLWLGHFLTSLLSEWLRLHLSILLRKDTLTSVQQTDLDTLSQSHRGDWLTRMTGDLHGAEYFLADGLPEQARQLVILVGSAALFWWHTGPIVLVPIAFALLLTGLNVVVQRCMAPALHQAREQEGRIFQFFVESLEGFRTIRAYHGEQTINEKLHQDLEGLKTISMRIMRRMGTLTGLNEFAGQLAITLCLTLLTYALTRDQLSVTDVLVYPFYLSVFLNAAKSIAAGTYEWNRFFIEGGRLAEIQELASPPSAGTGQDPVPEIPGPVDVEGLSFAYPGTPPLFAGLSFTLAPGEITVFCGPSGCGKSTLLEILCGLRHPQQGQFLIQSEPRSSLPLDLSAYVEQRPYLFAGTVRDNLRLGLETSDEDLWRSLARTGLSETIEARGGLDAQIDDQGQNWSEGQRYRLAVARALAAGRPWLLLDEPFASLDPASVELVIALLDEEARQGKAIAVITHQIPALLREKATHFIEMERPETGEPHAPPQPNSAATSSSPNSSFPS